MITLYYWRPYILRLQHYFEININIKHWHCHSAKTCYLIFVCLFTTTTSPPQPTMPPTSHLPPSLCQWPKQHQNVLFGPMVCFYLFLFIFYSLILPPQHQHKQHCRPVLGSCWDTTHLPHHPHPTHITPIISRAQTTYQTCHLGPRYVFKNLF